MNILFCSQGILGDRHINVKSGNKFITTKFFHQVVEPTVILSTLWLIRQKRGCSLPLFATRIPRSPPALPSTLTRRPGLHKRAHPCTLPLKDDKQCSLFPVSYIEPYFLLSIPWFDFPSRFFSIYVIFLQQ